MSKSKKVVSSDFQLSFYSNTTRIGIDKLKFNQIANHYVKKAIDEIFATLKKAKELNLKETDASAEIPYTVYPDVVKALEKYNKRQINDLMLLYYKHSPIGVIKEAQPISVPVCPECKLVVKKQMVAPEELTWWQKLIKFFFQKAFYQEPQWTFECNTHGRVDEPPYITM